MDNKLQDRIDDYVLGHMSEDDKILFEKELETNVELREQYNYTKLVKESVCEQAMLDELMEQWDEEIEQERTAERELVSACSDMKYGAVETHLDVASKEKLKSKRKILYWISGIAAVVLVGLFVINPFNREPDIVFSGNILSENTARGAGDLYEIQELIKNGNYKEALELIEEYENEMKTSEISDSCYNVNDSVDDEMREQLEYERMQKKMRLDDLSWLKVYAYIGLGRYDDAKTLLEQIRKVPGEYKEKADSLYNVMLNE